MKIIGIILRDYEKNGRIVYGVRGYLIERNIIF